MKLNQYLRKQTQGQIRNHNIFIEGGPGSGQKGHTTNHPDTIGEYNPDAMDDPKQNPAHPQNMTDEQEDRYGQCHVKSRDFVKKYGGDVFTTVDKSHSIAVKDNKVYDYVFGIDGMDLDEYTSTYPFQFTKQAEVSQ